MSDTEELPEWLTFEGLPDDIEWPPLRTSSGHYLVTKPGWTETLDGRLLYESSLELRPMSSDRFGVADDLRTKDLPLPDEEEGDRE